MDDFLSRRDSGGPPRQRRGSGGRFGFCFRQSRCLFPRFFFGKGALPLEEKKGHRPRMGFFLQALNAWFFTTRRMRAV